MTKRNKNPKDPFPSQRRRISREEVRIEALKVAMEMRSVAKPTISIIQEAREFEDYIINGLPEMPVDEGEEREN